jgi:hypothetical protein
METLLSGCRWPTGGIRYRPMAETLRDQGRLLIDMGLV